MLSAGRLFRAARAAWASLPSSAVRLAGQAEVYRPGERRASSSSARSDAQLQRRRPSVSVKLSARAAVCKRAEPAARASAVRLEQVWPARFEAQAEADRQTALGAASLLAS